MIKLEYYIVDRTEGNQVVLETERREHLIVGKECFLKLPADGDVVYQDGDYYRIDVQKTQQRRNYLAERTRRLFGK